MVWLQVILQLRGCSLVQGLAHTRVKIYWLYKSSDITGGPVEKETACKWLLAKTAARFPLFTGLPLPGPVLVQCRIQLSIGLAGLRAAVHNNGGVSCYNNSHYTTALLRFCHTRGSNCGPFIQSVLGIRYTRLRFGK